jgi:hypothetical protein
MIFVGRCTVFDFVAIAFMFFTPLLGGTRFFDLARSVPSFLFSTFSLFPAIPVLPVL